ncbi:MAG: DUF3821 domain-containing protein [Methanoregula sp.]|nr:DUF3821 domain-containing protein [Methanoregula sp.]
MKGLSRAGILLFIVISSMVTGVSGRVVEPGGTIFIGETNLDLSNCVSGDSVGWWEFSRHKTAPSQFIDFRFSDIHSFNATKGLNVGYWYNMDPSTGFATDEAFQIAEGKTK